MAVSVGNVRIHWLRGARFRLDGGAMAAAAGLTREEWTWPGRMCGMVRRGFRGNSTGRSRQL
ncbi:MAG: hypothetical protein H0Z37_09740 [Firmicutes bacterium]|nr:hypothetical protein [Bacillota bacterium]